MGFGELMNWQDINLPVGEIPSTRTTIFASAISKGCDDNFATSECGKLRSDLLLHLWNWAISRALP